MAGGDGFVRFANQLSAGNLRRVMQRVGEESVDAVTPAIRPNSLSHWRGGGARVGARYRIKSNTQVVVQPTVAPLAALLEDGSGSTWHSRRGRSYARRPVPPRGAWSKAAGRVADIAPKVVGDEVRRMLGSSF